MRETRKKRVPLYLNLWGIKYLNTTNLNSSKSGTSRIPYLGLTGQPPLGLLFPLLPLVNFSVVA